jgi:hypothetical protein
MSKSCAVGQDILFSLRANIRCCVHSTSLLNSNVGPFSSVHIWIPYTSKERLEPDHTFYFHDSEVDSSPEVLWPKFYTHAYFSLLCYMSTQLIFLDFSTGRAELYCIKCSALLSTALSTLLLLSVSLSGKNCYSRKSVIKFPKILFCIVLCCHPCPVLLYHILPHYLTHGTIFEKKNNYWT